MENNGYEIIPKKVEVASKVTKNYKAPGPGHIQTMSNTAFIDNDCIKIRYKVPEE